MGCLFPFSNDKIPTNNNSTDKGKDTGDMVDRPGMADMGIHTMVGELIMLQLPLPLRMVVRMGETFHFYHKKHGCS
ncbi:hypothetical protein LQ50_07520 [Halalkalibacter okhensis]|uniref:Uncharacterized protein n=1 Tax=Halalkalibacter okhensis TaxID=333138 RepID=A0A0B0IKQ3_9BACI|nr:hypothetical protein LQ50_07520 [Halalkalibacter okhensis]